MIDSPSFIHLFLMSEYIIMRILSIPEIISEKLRCDFIVHLGGDNPVSNVCDADYKTPQYH